MTLENPPISKFVLVCTSLLCCGIASLLWVPSPRSAPLIWLVLGALVFSLAGGFLFRAGLQSKVRVDSEGIDQTNGFSRQQVRWADVVAYYWISSRYMPQPVLLGADGAVLLRGFPPLAGAFATEFDRYKPFRRFIAEHLKGKEIESPFLHAVFWVPGHLDVDMSQQSWAWRIKHGLTSLAYAALCLAVMGGLLHYHLTVKTGPMADLVNRWIFPGDRMDLLILVGWIFQLPPFLLIFWQRRRLHRNLLPFKFVTSTEPPQASPSQ